MEIIALRAFSDNYIWALRQGNDVAVVDPGEAKPVLDYLKQSNGRLCAVLVTHRHADHIGGIAEILQHSELLSRPGIPVYAPRAEQDKITMLTHALSEGDTVSVPELGVDFKVLDVGGHTLGHIAYYAPGVLFCGDTLFAGGCGRIFEGTPEQMWHSLAKLAALPGDTRVYCAHEYTQSNLRFALVVEPGNAALQARNGEVARLREADQPTVPSTIAVERDTNPFLRWESPEVVAAARKYRQNASLFKPVDVFAAIREWKNEF